MIQYGSRKNFLSNLDEKLEKGVFEIANHEFAFGFSKFFKSKMADPTWRPEKLAFKFRSKIGQWGFLSLLIMNLPLDCENFENSK